jgi:hypothetical protein
MGWLAQRVGSATVLAVAGAVCVLAVWLFYRQLPRIRAAVAKGGETARPVLTPAPSEVGTA